MWQASLLYFIPLCTFMRLSNKALGRDLLACLGLLYAVASSGCFHSIYCTQLHSASAPFRSTSCAQLHSTSAPHSPASSTFQWPFYPKLDRKNPLFSRETHSFDDFEGQQGCSRTQVNGGRRLPLASYTLKSSQSNKYLGGYVSPPLFPASYLPGKKFILPIGACYGDAVPFFNPLDFGCFEPNRHGSHKLGKKCLGWHSSGLTRVCANPFTKVFRLLWKSDSDGDLDEEYYKTKNESLDEKDTAFFKRLKLSSNASLAEIEEAYERFIEDNKLPPKEKLRLKDQWYSTSNKLLSMELYSFSQLAQQVGRRGSQLSAPEKRQFDDIPSEFSAEYLNTVEWSPILKNKILSAKYGTGLVNSLLGLTLGINKVEGGIFQRSSFARFRTISMYMLPLAIVGLFIPPLSSPSMALSLMISIGVIANRGAPQAKRDEAGRIAEVKPPNFPSILLAILIVGLHGALGALSAMGLSKVAAIAAKIRQETLLAALVNLQLWFAALHYKTHFSQESEELDVLNPSLFLPPS